LRHYFSFEKLLPHRAAEQVGTPGPQAGTGRAAVADWWLAGTRGVEDETVAAAAPANTTDSAKMRIASFMIGNLFLNLDGME